MVASTRVSALTKRYPGVLALDDVSVDFRGGEVVALVGENGAGKSTLTRILAGLIPDAEFEGDVLVDDEGVAFHSPKDALDAGIVLIPQELSLHPQLTVAENVVVGRWPMTRLRTVSWREVIGDAEAYLALVGFQHDPRRLVGSLAPSAQQLVAIARGLARDAQLLLLDEPSAALDGPETDRLLGVIETLAGNGMALAYISHRLDEVFAVSSRIVVLRNGRLVSHTATSETDQARVIEAMLGRTPAAATAGEARAGRDDAAPVLTARVSLEDPIRRGRRLLDTIDIELRGGEMVGLVGLVGSGRTELLWSLFGALPRKGEVRVRGEVVDPRPWSSVSAGIGLVTEERRATGLFDLQTIAGNIGVASLERLAGPLGLLRRDKEDELGELAISKLDIKASGPRAPVATLSGGNQQKTVLGRWVMRDCHVLLLDEPARGIDVGSRTEIYTLLRALADSRRMAILTTSSDISELVGICDRFLVLRDGRKVAEVDGADATEHSLLALAGGAAHVPDSGSGRVEDPS